MERLVAPVQQDILPTMKPHGWSKGKRRPRRIPAPCRSGRRGSSPSVRPVLPRRRCSSPHHALVQRHRAVGGMDAGQKVGDRHTLARHLPRRAGDEAGQPRPRRVRQAQDRDRRLDRNRGDVDHPAPAARHHPRQHRLHQLDRRQHVGIQRADEILAAPVAPHSRRRPARIGDEDVHLRPTPRSTRRSALFRGDVGHHGRDLHPRPASAAVSSASAPARRSPDRRPPRQRPGAALVAPSRPRRRFLPAANTQIVPTSLFAPAGAPHRGKPRRLAFDRPQLR